MSWDVVWCWMKATEALCSGFGRTAHRNSRVAVLKLSHTDSTQIYCCKKARKEEVGR